jgi:putative sugar O-methyltransferase
MAAEDELARLGAERDAYLRQRDEAIGERDAYLRQRDEAIGERDAYLRQRDEAIGERNEFKRQLDEIRYERDRLLSERREPSTGRNGLGRMDDIVAMARRNLDSSLADAAAHLPDAGPRWGTLATWCRKQVPTLRTAEEAIHFAQEPVHHGGFESRFRGDDLASKATEQEALLLRSFPQFAGHFASFCEPELSNPSATMIINGRRVASPMYTHMISYFVCLTRVPKLDFICEIGCGYGGPARLALTNDLHRPNGYVIIDLPESLFFAECYLRATLGLDRVHYVGPNETLSSSGWATQSAVLCPVGRIAALTRMQFDLVINSLSMAEMSDEYVEF